MTLKKKSVLLGMSGGTDSSVAAMLLQDEGYDVTGVTFRFYDTPDTPEHLEDARLVAGRLGIEHLVYDARDLFEKEIVDYFVDEYMSGRTPVPCVRCNNGLKWPLLAKIADERNIDYIATGHYVNTLLHEGCHYIIAGDDPDKDQSFFLWGLGEDILSRMLLPLGCLSKQKVREIAAAKGFVKAARKKDSLGVCFCPGDYRNFLRRLVSEESIRPGFYEDGVGKILGKHQGYPFYTVGQRRGLGVNFSRPVFVQSVCRETNRVVLVHMEDMYKSKIFLKEVRVINPADFTDNKPIICRIRYRKQAAPCHVRFLPGHRAEVTLLQPEHSVAPGQAAAFYLDNRVLGGGIIECAE